MRFFLFAFVGLFTMHISIHKKLFTESNQLIFTGPVVEECLTEILLQQKLDADPIFKSHHGEIEKKAKHFFKNQSLNNSGHLKMDYTLPVVFHIVHQNGPENISDVDVQFAVDQLNDAMANINFYDQGVGVDTRIDFCLAKRDPDGHPTSGINRVVSPLTNLSMSQDLQLKNLSRWDPLSYINIWLVKDIGGAAGYAYLPSSHGGPEDGIVMKAEILTVLGGGHSTLVHEIGHYLGLYHTFQGGCANQDCLVDGDRVCDTPPDGSTAPPPGCVSVVNSCDTDTDSGLATDENDLYWNYVDYGNHACRAGYSQGQTDRMVFFIENVRQSLLESQACTDPCPNPFDASFTASAATVELGEAIIFTNTSTGGNDFEWLVNGVPFSSSNNASYLFNDGDGIYEITLVANNGDPNCTSVFSTNIEVLCPTGANFSASTLSTIAGGTVDFFNNSTDANNYEWQINGINFSNNTNASYTFNDLGNYEIKLIATHPTGNCSDEFFLYVQVDCIAASFSASELYPSPGNAVSFTNTTLGAQTYSWSINNVPEGNTIDLNYTFLSPGVYTVCLEAFNGFCEDDFCQQLFVIENTDPGCNPAFVKVIGEANQDEIGHSIIPSHDGHFYLSGSVGTKSLIMKVDATGTPIWQRSFQFTNQQDFLLDIMVDSDHNLVGCGMGWDGAPEAFTAFAFKYDPINDNIIWLRNFSAASMAFNIVEAQAGGDYLTVLMQSGIGGQDGMLTYLDRDDGSVSNALYQTYNLGSSETFYEAIIVNNEIYTIGRYTNGAAQTSMRWGLSKYDLAGNEIYSKLSFVPLNGFARLYPTDLMEENGAIYSIGTGDDNGSSTTVTNVFFQKNDLDGNLEWVRKYEFPAYQGEAQRALVSVPDGFLLYGNEKSSPKELWLMKTDKDGNVQWAKSYGGAGDEQIENLANSQLFFAGDAIYFTAETRSFGGDKDILFIKTDRDGNLTDACLVVNEVEVIATTVPNPANTDISLATNTSQIAHNSGQLTPDALSLTVESVAECECEESSTDCESTFVSAFGTGGVEMGRFVMAMPDGLLIGGVHDGAALLMQTTEDGELVWERTLDIVPNESEIIADMILDSEGHLMVVGTTEGIFGTNRVPFIFKYDYLNDNLIWVKTLELTGDNRSNYYTVLENPLDGNYFVLGQVSPASAGSCDGLFLEIDKNNGNTLNSRAYNLWGCDSFFGAVLLQDKIYTAGRFVTDNFSNADKLRPTIAQLDFNGNTDWSKSYLVNNNLSARIYAYDIHYENNALFVITSGDLSGSSATDITLQFFKTDLNGNIQWAKDFSINNGALLPSNLVAIERNIMAVPDGFILSGTYLDGEENIFLIKTNKNGEMQWAKGFGGIGEDQVTSIAYKNGYIYLAGWTASFGSGNTDALLLKLDLDGNIPNTNCDFIKNIDFLENSINNPFEGTIDFSEHTPNASYPSVATDVIDVTLNTSQLCFFPCIDTCQNGAPIHQVPDAALQFVQADCNGENKTAQFQVCNMDSVSLPVGTPVSIYGNDPTLVNAQLIETVELADSVLPGDCKIFTYTFDIPINQELFAVVNDSGTTPTPFDLSADFPNTSVEECDFTNNINQFRIDFTPPALDLGPDVTVCDFGVVDLDAGPGFATYLWSDATTEQITTAWQPGLYWVEVTDSCGGVQVDSILLAVEPASIVEIGADTVEVCLGDSVSFSASGGFNSYQWVSSAYLSCDTCAMVTATPDTTVTYILVAGEGDGCVSEDTVTVVVSPTLMTYDTMSFCTGDTVLIFGNEISAVGDYSEIFSSANGCDSVHTITLVAATDTILSNSLMSICEGDSLEFFGNWLTEAGSYDYFDNSSSCVLHYQLDLIVNDVFFNTDTVFICEGDSTLVFGNYESTEGVFTVVFPSSNGCDSTEQIRLIISDTIFTNEIIEICANEMAGVFGTMTNVPGVYSEIYTTGSDCDSLHQIQVIVHDTFSLNDTIYLCAGDSVLIFGNYETAAGIYTELNQSMHGCDSTSTVWLEILDTAFTIETIEICADEMADIFGVPTNMAGIYSQIFPSVNGCDSTHAIELIVHDTFLTEAFLEICFGDSILIFGNYETAAGIYSELNQSMQGCDSTSVVQLEIFEEIILEMESSPACSGTEVGAVSVNVINGVAPFSYTWNVPNAPDASTLVDVPAGVYSVTVTGANNCSASATATVESLPGISINPIVVDVDCAGDAGGTAEIMVDVDSALFSLNGIDFQAAHIFNGLTAGDYLVTVIDLSTGCTAEEIFSIAEPLPPVINLPPDVTIELGDAINIVSNSPQNISNYSWTPDQWLDCSSCPEVLAQPPTTILYTLNILDQNGCPGADSMLVTVEFNPRIFIPNAFSPNDDGINDRFFPYSKGVAEIKLLRIFNRWGSLVYEAAGFQPNDPDQGWDGTFKGKLMDPAVFAYFVRVVYADGTEEVLEGDLTLIR